MALICSLYRDAATFLAALLFPAAANACILFACASASASCKPARVDPEITAGVGAPAWAVDDKKTPEKIRSGHTAIAIAPDPVSFTAQVCHFYSSTAKSQKITAWMLLFKSS